MGEHDRAWELFALLNPIRHGSTADGIATYKVEPYVVAADVYALAPHTGRGGWTWYTGSAGWMYRLMIETLLGVTLAGDQLSLTPRLPKHWKHVALRYRFRSTVYRVSINQLPAGSPDVPRLLVDKVVLAGATITLRDDRQEHLVEMTFRHGSGGWDRVGAPAAGLSSEDSGSTMPGVM